MRIGNRVRAGAVVMMAALVVMALGCSKKAAPEPSERVAACRAADHLHGQLPAQLLRGTDGAGWRAGRVSRASGSRPCVLEAVG